MTATQTKLRQAVAKHQSGDLEFARQSYVQILQQEPRNADAWHLLGLVAFQVGDSPTAKECMEHALAIQPNLGPVYPNYGLVLESLGEIQKAKDAYQKAVQLQPDNVPSWNNLGSLLRKQREFPSAEECLQKSHQLAPKNPDTLNHLGLLRMDQGRLEEAVAYFEASCQLNPHDATVHVNRGSALKRLHRFEDSLAAYREAIRLQPNSASVYNNLANLFQSHLMIEEALACYRQALKHPSPFSAHYHSNLLFLLNYTNKISAEDVQAEHVRWGQTYKNIPALPLGKRDWTPDRPLRIGYISPDLRQHAMARFIEPVFLAHDRTQFTIYAYAEVLQPDTVSERMKQQVHTWRSTVGLSDQAVAEMIQKDEIDLLIDLAGHTAGNRLPAMAYRPAPIQATWLGYCNTTGLPQMDYFLTDATLDPPEDETFYTETLIRLPSGVACFQPPDNAPEIDPLPAWKNGHITFGSLHRPNKLNDGVFDLWAKVLQAVPQSRLLIFWGNMEKAIQKKFTDQLLSLGLSADRFDIETATPEQGYLEVYNRIDLGLDVFPWTGGTTTHEALWMGVVLLGLAGKKHVSRGTQRILNQVGLNNFVAATPEQYVQLASQYADRWEELAQLRTGMRQRLQQTVCNSIDFTRHLEQTYRQLWHRYLASR